MSKEERQRERLKERDAILHWMRQYEDTATMLKLRLEIKRGAHRTPGDLEEE